MSKFQTDFLPIPFIAIQDKDLNPASRMVLGLIYYITEKRGDKFFMSNKYIGDILHISGGTVKNSLTMLESKGYVKRLYKEDSDNVRSEIVCGIKVCMVAPDSAGVALNDDVGSTKQCRGVALDSAHNKINTNKIKNKTSVQKKETPKGQISVDKGKSPVMRVMWVYRTLWKLKYGTEFKMNSIPKYASFVKKLTSDYSEIQIGAMICCMFNWYGISGSDQREHDFVEKAFFPFSMILSQSNKYETYLRNVEKLNFDDVDSVKKYIINNLQ